MDWLAEGSQFGRERGSHSISSLTTMLSSAHLYYSLISSNLIPLLPVLYLSNVFEDALVNPDPKF